MPRFRKTSRLTKKGGSPKSGLHLLADTADTLEADTLEADAMKRPNTANRAQTPETKPNTANRPQTPEPNKINSATGAATLGNVFNVRSAVQTNLNSKLNEHPNRGGGYKKSRKNSRIKSKRKKRGKSAKKRRRRTRGKKR